MMKNWITAAGSALLAIVLTGAICGGNNPPAAPTVSGPPSGGVLDTLTFRASADDPEEDNLQYKVDFGDGEVTDWTTSSYASGALVSFKHAYADSGHYEVKAMARDAENAESGWSEGRPVTVDLRNPFTPPVPTGPATCTTEVVYHFAVTGTHPQGDSLWFQFDWGDTTGNWSGPVPSGSTYTGVHSWGAEGSYALRVRARDAEERTSGWSDPLNVTVVKLSGGVPTGFRLGPAGGGLTVQLSWNRPVEGAPNEYLVLFRDATTWDTVARPTTEFYVHDPAGKTGDYLLAARFDTALYFAGDSLTTVPVHTVETAIFELNGTGDQGYGWDIATGAATTHSMGAAGNAGFVDLFCTDFATGHAGPTYTAASPNYGPSDPGGGVPPGNWRESWFTPVTGGENDPLPLWTNQAYFNDLDINNPPARMACYTEEQHYALVKFASVNTGTGEVRLESWFQKVVGLRLIEH